MNRFDSIFDSSRSVASRKNNVVTLNDLIGAHTVPKHLLRGGTASTIPLVDLVALVVVDVAVAAAAADVAVAVAAGVRIPLLVHRQSGRPD